MMPYIISIIGKSNSGKTTLIERLIPILKKRIGKLGTIKHDVHGFQIDHPGKDSYRHYHAGSDGVLITDAVNLCFQEKASGENDILTFIKRFFNDYDLILIEGYKALSFPKIEILRKERGLESISWGDKNLKLIATDTDEKEIKSNNPKAEKNDTVIIDINDYEMASSFILREWEKYDKKENR